MDGNPNTFREYTRRDLTPGSFPRFPPSKTHRLHILVWRLTIAVKQAPTIPLVILPIPLSQSNHDLYLFSLLALNQTLTTLVSARLKRRFSLAQPNRVLAYASEPVCLWSKDPSLFCLI